MRVYSLCESYSYEWSCIWPRYRSSGRLGLREITIAPHTDGPQQHRHGQHDEGFYVVSGTARFTVGETSYDAPAGTLVMVPPGAPHTFANVGAEVIFDTRLDPFLPRDAVYLRATSEHLAFSDHRRGARQL